MISSNMIICHDMNVAFYYSGEGPRETAAHAGAEDGGELPRPVHGRSGVHKGGFSKGGVSNLCIIIIMLLIIAQPRFAKPPFMNSRSPVHRARKFSGVFGTCMGGGFSRPLAAVIECNIHIMTYDHIR